MENAVPDKKTNWGKFILIALFVFGIILLFLILFPLFEKNNPREQHSTDSELINTNEIADLSVSEFIYNGKIGRAHV